MVIHNNHIQIRQVYVANIKYLYDIYAMLDQRRIRWADVV